MTFSNFWDRAAQHPEQVAIVETDERRISAGELLASVNQLTHGLRALGLQRGDVIAAVLPNSLQAYELYLAMQQMGIYLVPINFHLVGPEIAYIVQDCEAKAFIINARFADAGRAVVAELGFPETHAFAVGSAAGFRDYEELKAGQPTDTPADRSARRGDALHIGHHRPPEGRTPRAAGHLAG